MDEKTDQRRYELDWLRVLAVFTVFVYHCALIFGPDRSSIKNPITYQFVDDVSDFAGSWGMPLILLISGASTYHALGRVSPGKYIKGIVARLLIPLVVGIFTHCVFQVYLERVFSGDFGGSFFEFYPHYFEGMYAFGGNFAWMGLHLWYLEALFIYSLIFLPFFLFIKKNRIGQCILKNVGDFMARSGAIYLFTLPAFPLINFLDPDTWGTTALGGWSIFIYPGFFVAGFLIISNDRLQASIVRWRWVSLVVGILLSSAIDILWDALGDPMIGTWGFVLGSGVYCLSAWCWLLAITGYGMKHLKFNTALLKYANEAVLPFYILHMTVVVTIGYYVVDWSVPDLIKFLTILIVSFLITIGLYEFLVRRINFLRFLFGMKTLPKSPDVQTQLELSHLSS